MQLDKTLIAIRERDMLEILDLALHVVRAFFVPLTLALAVGILPTALVCHYLAADQAGIYEEGEWQFNYAVRLLVLAVLAAPLATAPGTLLLGQALFHDKPNAVRIVRDLWGSLVQLILFQVVLRTLLLVMIVTSFVPYVFCPYLSEIVLLERNPLWKGRHHRITTRRRSTALHGGRAGDLLGRWLFSAALAGLLLLLLVLALAAMRQWVTGTAGMDHLAYVLFLQIAVWSVVAYFTVVRFLSYLDLRIRREGWEVELKMRAEAVRLARQLV
jgi:hypothetical protein